MAPLYVHRPLLNAGALATWAKRQGFKSVIADSHVTVLYSKEPVDWDAMGIAADRHSSTGGVRAVDPLGDQGAVVLRFTSPALKNRHDQMVAAGASHDYEDFTPHVTITYQGGDVDLSKVVPYAGPLLFGPEEFREIIPDRSWTPPQELLLDERSPAPAVAFSGREYGNGADDREQHITAAAGVLFVDPDGRALFLLRQGDDHAGEWSIPAGGIEDGETGREAASREAAEEVGYPGDFTLRWIESRTNADGVDFSTFRQDVPMAFEPILNDEHSAFCWKPLSNPPLPLHPGLAATLRGLTQDFNPDQPRVAAGQPGGGQWGAGTATGGEAFISPNVEHLNFSAAEAGLQSPRQASFLKLSRVVDESVGLGHRTDSTIGAWADGAENGLVARAAYVDFPLMKALTAIKAHIGAQKQALLFREDPDGKEFMATFDATLASFDVHTALLAQGVAFHTLEVKDDYTRVHVYGSTQAELDNVVKAADMLAGTRREIAYGHGEFIGTKLPDSAGDAEQRLDARREYEAIIAAAAVDPELQGRDVQAAFDSARTYWASAPGGGRVRLSTDPPAPVASAGINPEVIDVGGDQWNRDTALRLETEYAAAKPKLEALALSLVGGATVAPEPDDDEDEPSGPPDEWDVMSGDQQEATKEKWIEDNTGQEQDYQLQNWHDNGDALDDAKQKLVQEFDDDSWNAEKGIQNSDWFTDALDAVREEREENDGSHIPYTNEQLWRATVLTSEQGKKDDISFDDDKLQDPDNMPPAEQLTLPGIEPEQRAGKLTAEMRAQLKDVVMKAFQEKADDIEGDMEPPEYINDVSESLSDSFESMDDDAKFKFAKDNDIIDDPDAGTPNNPTQITLPGTFDPLGKTEGADYKRTGALGRELSVQRAADIMIERHLLTDRDAALALTRKMDGQIWSGWKGSSTGEKGSILQAAAAQELGGRLHEFRDISVGNGRAYANSAYGHAFVGSEAGFEAAKAYVRGKWETTQYLLDKAGDNTVNVYRGVELDHTASAENNQGAFSKLPDISIQRNGAASTSTDQSVANNWDGGNRVVLRLSVPRTAVLAVPAYGQNVYKEHEAVVMGTAWKGWDAWHRRAPEFGSVPVETASEHQHAA